MNFLRTKFQTVINRVQAIKRRFRRPRQISEGGTYNGTESIIEIDTEAEAGVPEPFQLLDLPQVVLRKIVHHLGSATVIDLSMTSENFYEKMKAIKLSAEEFSWYLDKDRIFLSCFFEDSYVSFWCSPEGPSGQVVERRIGGKVKLVSMNREDEPEDGRRSFISYHSKLSQRHQSEEEVELTAHLLDIIRPEKYGLRLSGERNLMDLFVWKFCTNFEAIGLDPEYAIDLFGPKEAQFLFQEVVVREIGIQFETMSENWIKEGKSKLLDATRSMKLRNTIQEIIVTNFDLFSAENIINSEIKFLVVLDHSEDSDELVYYKKLNKIMKAWQEGEKLTQLEKIDTPCKGMSDEELQSSFEGIDWTSERPNHPQFEDFVKTHDLVRDSLIRRRTDGQLASLSKYKNMFLFVVWKEGDLRLKPIYF